MSNKIVGLSIAPIGSDGRVILGAGTHAEKSRNCAAAFADYIRSNPNNSASILLTDEQGNVTQLVKTNGELSVAYTPCKNES